MNLGIAGETALVVGASEGIGYETAKALLEEGADVTIVSRDAAKLERAAATLEQATGSEVRRFAADITDAAQVAALERSLGQALPRIDILVNAVGGSRRALFEELDDAAW